MGRTGDDLAIARPARPRSLTRPGRTHPASLQGGKQVDTLGRALGPPSEAPHPTGAGGERRRRWWGETRLPPPLPPSPTQPPQRTTAVPDDRGPEATHRKRRRAAQTERHRVHGNDATAQSRAPGQTTPERARSTRQRAEARSRATRRERACAVGGAALPVVERARPHAKQPPTEGDERGTSATSVGGSQHPSRAPAPRGARGGRESGIGPDSAPLPSARHQRARQRGEGPANRTRRAVPFAMNVRPSPGAA